MRISFLVPALVLGLAACQEDEANLPDPAADACDAAGWSHLIGQNRDVLAATTFPAPMRVIGPNDAVTMDFLPNRLNVVYDAEGVIVRVECG